MLGTIEAFINRVIEWLSGIAFLVLYVVALDGPMFLAFLVVAFVGIAVIVTPIVCGWKCLRCLERRSPI